MRTGIYRVDIGTLEMVVDSFDAAVEDMTDRATVEVPDGWPVDLAWDADARAFGPNLARWRAARRAQAEAYRDGRVNGGCMTASGPVDSDPVSRGLITGSVSMATIAKAAGAPFATTWRMQDNSYVGLDADAMIAMGVAVGEHVAACYEASFAVKDLIDAAADKAAIEAVDITAGYPA